MGKNGIDLEITPEAIDALASFGYEPEFGARPLKRLMQREILSDLSKRILPSVTWLQHKMTCFFEYIVKNFKIEINLNSSPFKLKTMKYKNFKILLLAMSMTALVNAQTYHFSVGNGSYTELSSPSLLSNNMPWKDGYWTLNLPFKVKFFEKEYTQVGVADGYVGFETDGVIRVFDNDLIDAGYGSGSSQSPVSYQVFGSAPNRIIKIQWKNVHFDADPGNSDFANFQLWFYEGGKIEMHYGASSVNNSQSYDTHQGALVLIYRYSPSKFVGLENDPANPSIETNIAGHFSLTGHPANGTVYEFNYGFGVGIVKTTASQTRVYPVPMNETLHVELPFEGLKQVQILDVTGKIVSETPTYAQWLMLPVNHLNEGAYILKISTVDEEAIFKLVK